MVSEVKNIETEKLWDYAMHGSPTVSAMALTILDKMYGGKISEIKDRILNQEGKRNAKK